jgi:phosphoribosyl 1,2-cyclic phosphodiesterase
VPIAGALVTHFDSDHWNPSWLAAFPEGATLHVHREHRSRAERSGAAYLRTNIFEGDFELLPGVVVRSAMNAHDDQGTVAYRVEAQRVGEQADLGYATDIGKPSEALARLLRGVDVLAVESNYCPDMQLASSRPEFLKRRIMSGGGHLSNQQSAALVRSVAPRSSVVLLHLSLECNTPQRAAAFHRHDPLRLTISSWDRPTEWIAARPSPCAVVRQSVGRSLWEVHQ